MTTLSVCPGLWGFLGCGTCGVKPGAIAHAKSNVFPLNRVLEIKVDQIQVVFMARLLHRGYWVFSSEDI